MRFKDLGYKIAQYVHRVRARYVRNAYPLRGHNRKARRTANAILRHNPRMGQKTRDELFAIRDSLRMIPARAVLDKNGRRVYIPAR